MEKINFEKTVTEIKKVISEAGNILLHFHPSPDPDSVGSVLALAEYGESLGKEVTVIGGDSDLSQSLAHLPGFEKVVSKSFGEIEAEQFDLFLALDAASPEMISKKDEVIFPVGMTVINIDHHPTNTNYGAINLVLPDKAATAEIIYELFTVWQAPVSPTMATNLYVGLYGDTGGFKYPNTTANTLRSAAGVVAVNSEAPTAILKMQYSATPGTLRYRGLALNNLEIIAGDQAGLITLSFAELEAAGINPNDSEGVSLSSDLLYVKDWLVGASLVEKEPGRIRLSLRSKDASRADVSKVAVVLGGGGHGPAAGGLLLMPLAEAKRRLVAELEKVIGQ